MGNNSTSTASGYNIAGRIWVLIDGIVLDRFDIKASNSLSPSITLITSTKLTKILYTYINANGLINVYVKSVYYISNMLVDLTFNDLPHFIDTISSIPKLNQTNFDLGEYYIVVRNDTSNISSNPYE